MQEMYSEQSEQHPRVYTAEEAGEILKRAVRLQEERLTTQQLYSIAEEAGIRRETLEQAIWEHERAKIASQFQKSQKPLGRWARFKRAIRRLFVATMLLTVGFFTGVFLVASLRSSLSFPSTRLLASSNKLSVLYDDSYSNGSILIEHAESTQSHVLGIPAYPMPRIVTISPSSAFIAIEKVQPGGVYVVRSDGTGLQEVIVPSRLADQLLNNTREEYYYGVVISGWHKIDGKEFLVLQLETSNRPDHGFEPTGVFVRYDPETGTFDPHTTPIGQ